MPGLQDKRFFGLVGEKGIHGLTGPGTTRKAVIVEYNAPTDSHARINEFAAVDDGTVDIYIHMRECDRRIFQPRKSIVYKPFVEKDKIGNEIFN